jgi:hypothetical protein
VRTSRGESPPTEDFYEDLKGMKEHYKMSEYSKESGMYDGENRELESCSKEKF